jgi:hypothetical protein
LTVPDLLRLVWDRADTHAPTYSADETAAWPAGALDRLLGLGLLKPVTQATAVVCDACGGDHVEEVVFVEAPPGTGLRAYLRCPEAGRVPVPLERLRQWALDFPGLAVATARALGVAGDVEELVPSRVWLLGRTALAGISRPVFLARGLGWKDGAEVLGRAAQRGAGAGPLVLVPGSPPPAAVWQGVCPAVLPLGLLLSLSHGVVTLDRSPLEQLRPKGRPAPPAPSSPFPTPAAATWPDVCLTLTDLQVRVEVMGRRREFTFQEAGFEDRRRRQVPNHLWALLRVFALRGGVVPLDDPQLAASVRTNLKQAVSQLTKHLRRLLQLEGSPFGNARGPRRYEAHFRIADEAGILFPTPPDTAWDQVTVTEVRPGVLTVAVAAPEVFPVYVSAGEEDGRGGWEAGERQGAVVRRYDLRTLGLADADGQPTPAGAALVAVLRAGGWVRRPATDPGMLALCRFLGRLLQINDSPFQFVRAENRWAALFEASSRATDGSR